MPTAEDEVNQGLASLEVAFGSKKEGDLDAARCFFSRAALKIPKAHDSYPICLAQLAEIDERNQDWLGALRFNLNLLVELEHRHGERDEQTIGIMDKAAALFEKVGRNDESNALYERARSLSQRSLWADQASSDNIGAIPPPIMTPVVMQPEAVLSTTPKSVSNPLIPNSMAMLEAFENAYQPYLTPDLIGPEDISLDYLDRKLNLRGRLSRMRLDAEAAKANESGSEKFMTALRAKAAQILAPLLGFLSKYLTDRNKILLGIFVCSAIVSGAAYLLVKNARTIVLDEQFTRVPHTFSSADGQKTFIWLTQATCEMAAGADHFKVRTRVYRGQIPELFELAFTPVIQKQYWLELDPTKVVDQDGGVMYADAGPESRIIQDLQGIIRGATYVFLEKKSYPKAFESIIEALEKHEKGKFPFKNQYSGDEQKPFIKTIDFNAKDDREGDQWRSDLLQRLNSGQLLEGEEKFAAGEPRGYVITDSMPRGIVYYFVARAADRDGQILRGNASGQFNYFAIDEGNLLKSQKCKPFFDPKSEFKPRVVWILQEPLSASSKLMVQNAATAFCFAFCFALAATFLSTYKKSVWKAVSLIGAVGMLLLTIAFYVSPYIP